ncbi:hypothetical protein DL95DRAFT_466674 [Leptodontidium sp. 2 PMI_412]|nr:hypothetical protein DL95DRAFT_466674 [Leptodontidium sp. 2 PMI_412]
MKQEAEVTEGWGVQSQSSIQKLKNKIRLLRLVSRFFGTVLAGATLYLESRTLHTFATTHTVIRGNRGPWARQTTLWPSVILVAASGITLFFGLLTMMAYTRSFRSADRVNFYGTIITTTIEAAHITIWIIVAVLYRTGKTGHDLWGWACSPLAQKIEPNFEGLVDFSRVCKRGSTNFALSIANSAVTILNLCIWILVLQRMRYVKMQEKQEQRNSTLAPGDC